MRRGECSLLRRGRRLGDGWSPAWHTLFTALGWSLGGTLRFFFCVIPRLPRRRTLTRAGVSWRELTLASLGQFPRLDGGLMDGMGWDMKRWGRVWALHNLHFLL